MFARAMGITLCDVFAPMQAYKSAPIIMITAKPQTASMMDTGIPCRGRPRFHLSDRQRLIRAGRGDQNMAGSFRDSLRVNARRPINTLRRLCGLNESAGGRKL